MAVAPSVAVQRGAADTIERIERGCADGTSGPRGGSGAGGTRGRREGTGRSKRDGERCSLETTIVVQHVGKKRFS